ncbi:hypothetical protein RJ640_014445 [Escallonia rubra]|uniref:RING-type E3 ubiquitin transferase n=1 Tax=Escallonia rubra TaxID=112253 RepID=A0AA88QPR3_9ASTE|nr:hypothetical protein RJ640_014445 [Escallonia rubra]
MDVSPLFIGLLGVMAGAMVVAAIHCILVGWCRTNSRPTSEAPPIRRRRIVRAIIDQANAASASTSSSLSTSNSTLQLTSVYKYSIEFKEGMCAVCISEFKEGDDVRILPDCAHVFHVSCIDMWLYSHPNCPLCRTDTLPPPPQHVIVSLLDTGVVPAPEP